MEKETYLDRLTDQVKTETYEQQALQIKDLIKSLGYKLDNKKDYKRFNKISVTSATECMAKGIIYLVYIMNIENKHSITWDDRIDIQADQKTNKFVVHISTPKIIIKDGKETEYTKNSKKAELSIS